MLSIVQITDLPIEGFEALVRESEDEGFRFLKRLRDEWRSDTNRFSKASEAFFGVMEDRTLLAVGGLNRESDRCGRLRRFYVTKNGRRRGVGRFLAQHILRFAAEHYSSVVLKTDTEVADRFYIALGFTRLPQGGGTTHIIEMKRPNKALEPTPTSVTSPAFAGAAPAAVVAHL